jgi:hypothetical protein
MKKTGEIRRRVAEILTERFGDEAQGIVFMPEDAIRRSGGGERRTKYILKNSVSWSTETIGATGKILVHCVGLTMTEFIKESEKGNLCFIRDKSSGIPLITIYPDTPTWKTSGHVKAVDLQNAILTLRILDFFDFVRAPISSETPMWLLDEEHGIVSFSCKIHQWWRSTRNYDELDWSKIWKTFRFDQWITSEDAECF